jgi:hypothetical protein
VEFEHDEYNKRFQEIKIKHWAKKDEIDKSALRNMQYEPRKYKGGGKVE